MRILIATDLSAGGDIALQEGASLAVSPTDVVGVVHVLPRLIRESMFFPPRDESLEERATKLIERISGDLRDRVRRAVPRANDIFVDEGIDYAAILQRAELWRADIVVVGSYGLSGLARATGSVALRVVRHGHCAVLVARGKSRAGWVLAATDLSDPSLPAITAGAKEARRRGAKLKVVHAVGFLEVEATYLLQMASPTISKNTPELGPARSLLENAVAKLGVSAECEVIEAPAAAAIVRAAEATGAELVVVGSHGRTALTRLAMGSVADKVVQAAGCSVLVVRHSDAL